MFVSAHYSGEELLANCFRIRYHAESGKAPIAASEEVGTHADAKHPKISNTLNKETAPVVASENWQDAGVTSTHIDLELHQPPGETAAEGSNLLVPMLDEGSSTAKQSGGYMASLLLASRNNCASKAPMQLPDVLGCSAVQLSLRRNHHRVK